MAHWNDQEEFVGEQIISSIAVKRGAFAEVERAHDGDSYRITVGNLFGSQSVHVKTAYHALRLIGLLNSLPDAGEAKLDLKDIPGFIRLEERG